MPELIRHPVFERLRVGDRPQPRLRVAHQAARRLVRPQVQEGVRGLDRVVEELPPVHDPRQPRHLTDLVAQDLGPEGFDLGALGEKPMRADVEAATHELERAGDPSYLPGILLHHRHRRPVPGQLVGGRQPGGPGAHHHHVLGGTGRSLVSHAAQEQLRAGDPLAPERGPPPEPSPNRDAANWGRLPYYCGPWPRRPKTPPRAVIRSWIGSRVAPSWGTAPWERSSMSAG